jgi:PKD repeat protein
VKHGRSIWLAGIFVLVCGLAASAGTTHADSPVFSLDTRIPTGTVSADSGIYVLNTRGTEGMDSCGGSGLFLLDTRDPSLNTPIVMQGRITDTNGIGIAGVTVSFVRGGIVVAQATTDAHGYYQLPPLTSIACVLKVTVPGYATAARALTLSAGTALENFQLAALPAAPAMQQVNRALPFTFTPIGSLGEMLEIFNGTVFTNISPNNALSPNLMTIVLTHGWVPMFTSPPIGVDSWPTTMAAALRANGITTNIANIVAYDWRYVAQALYPPDESTPAEGVLLGQSLQTELGASYTQQIHFIGHSLGALVNAAAANYLHRDRTAHQEVAPTRWSPTRTHMTLLDGAEAAAVFGLLELSFNGISGNVPTSNNSIGGYDNTLLGWKPALPVHCEWADNYISLFGLYQTDAVNVFLDADLLWGVPAKHGFAWQWYTMTVANATDCILGFQRSHEARLAGASAFEFPPSPVDFPPGVAYVQPENAADPLHLVLAPIGTRTLGIGESLVLQGAAGTVQVIGNVTASIVHGAQASEQWLANGFDYVAAHAAQGGQALMNLSQSPVLSVTLSTGAASPAPMLQANAVRILDVSGGSTTDTSTMAWIPAQIPTGAIAMAFDFIVTGDPVNDVLVCGFGTNNLFSLEAKYIPTNSVSASRLLDVSAWAGTTNELFFGLIGGTSTNATLQVDNIRFYSLQPPVASFVAAPTNSPAALTVDFTDMSSGTITNWFWDFGDGTSTNLVGTSVSHTYVTSNATAVSLIVSGPTGSGTNTQYAYPAGPASMITLSVLANPVNGGSVSGVGQYSVGSNATLTATASNNWFFIGWSDGSTNNPYSITVPPTNVTYTAIFRRIDSVGDGIPDAWRTQYFGGDGTTTNAQTCATADPDGDGLTNQQEFLAGTNPNDASSGLRMLPVSAAAQTNSTFVIQWQSAAGKFYNLERSTNLVNGFDTTIKTHIPATLPINSETDTNAVGPGPWFYRVRLE